MIRPLLPAALSALMPGAVLTAMLLASPPARAANTFCESEMGPLIKQRLALTQRLQYLGKHGQEPGARDKFCGTLTSYMGNIKQIITYMQTNKDFCGVPDDAISAARKGLAQNASLRYKICVLGPKQQQAAQARAAQNGGAPGGAPVLKPPVELKLE